MAGGRGQSAPLLEMGQQQTELLVAWQALEALPQRGLRPAGIRVRQPQPGQLLVGEGEPPAFGLVREKGGQPLLGFGYASQPRQVDPQAEAGFAILRVSAEALIQ